jgi:CSLREA domain-containing protein
MQTAHHRKALIETFESRILYSADPTPTGLAAAALAGLHQHLDATSNAEQVGGVEIAFIDARLPDVQVLLDDLAAQQRAGKAIEAILIAADEDGISVISSTLAGRSDVSAVHLIGHGSDGVIEMGAARLDAGALLQRAGEISGWGDALSSQADLLLYGCDVAADENGQSLVDGLAQLTGADVAASDDPTGSALLGGDWDLEYTTGSITATPFASTLLQASWGSVLSLTPQGGETLVNATTSGSQQPMMGTKSVAMDANGNYIVVWQDGSGADGSGIGIYGQRYNAAGTAQGAQFRVNTYTAGDQEWPEVAMDASGNFVVVWQSQGQDGSNLGVYARRYNAAGTALDASDFRVNQTTNLDQGAPAVATDSAGNFVVSWVTRSQDAVNTWGIYARRFGANGTALSNEFQVNTYTASDQEVSTIAMDSSGNFVIAWSSNGQDGSTFGIYAQRFDAAGAKQGSEFRVNSTTADAQTFPSIAMDTSGFVIVWQSNLQDGSDLGVYGQRYNASGAALGGEFRINTTVADAQTRVMVASTGSGGFLVTWNSNLQDGSLRGAYMRQYDSSGAALTGEVLVNTTTSGDQVYPSVAADAKSHAVVVWGGNGIGDNDGIFMQRYISAYPPILTLSGYSANYVENAAAIYDASATVTDDDSAVFNNGQLLYQITANGTATDELGIRNQGISAGQIGISGSNVTYGGVIIGTYSGSFGNGSTPLTVTFNSNATVAAVQALVRNITYRDTSENPSTATRTISLTISDGSGQSSTPAVVTMAVTAVNDPPVIGSNGGGATASVSVAENTTAVTTVSSTDVDGGTAAYSLSGADAAKFSIDSSGALRFISAPDYEAPTDTGLNNVYDVTVQVSDGAGGSDTQAIAVTVTNVNEAPILNTTPAVALNAQQEDSGAPSGAVGTLISSLVDFVDGAGWNNVTDEDSGASLGVAIVAANTTSGSWYYTINGGTNWSALGTVSTASARLLAADTLTRVYFVPNSNYNGTQSSAITIRAWDRSSGSNGSLADTAMNGGSSAFSAATDTISLTIDAVNDEPSITTNTGVSFSEGSTGNVITAAMLATSDVDNTAAQLTYTLTAIPTNGTLYRGGVVLAGSASFTQADINAGLLTYTHDGSESTGDSFAFSVDDGAGSASSGNFTITINGVNDNAPVITSNGGGASASISVAENTIAVTTVSATDADIPSSPLTYSLSGGVDMNKFSIHASTGVLRFLTAPDFENPADNGGNNVYDLIVQVSDGSLTDTQTIAVTVTNVASELVVTTTADLNDGDTSSIGALVLNKGADGRISLREAIEAANNTAGADTITFNIADALVGGAHTINLVSMLPTITGTLTIDGSTEPDWTTSGSKPVVVINGGGTLQDGLQLYTGSDGSTIRGLVIQNFTQDGIDMAYSNGHHILGNRIGTSADGSTAAPTDNAINLWASSGNQIGGTGANDGNLLSGNYGPGLYMGNGSDNNLVLGNLIGLNAAGTAALGNQWHGVYVIDSSNNQFGGTSAAERNVIAASGSNGLYLGGASSGNVVQGNYIGLDASGNNAIGNSGAGVMLSAGASGNTIGGATAATRNIISGNTQYGVYLTGSSTSDNLIRNNYIGVDAAGTTALSNGGFGVVVDALAANTTITDNLISGNTNASWSSARGGIYLYADGVTIQGNTIGLGASGGVLGNGGGAGVTGGILANSGSINVLIGGTGAGEGNVIAGNIGPGVVVGTTTSATRVLGNSIYANTGLGIDLGTSGVTSNDAGDGDSGANALQNYPVLTAAFTSGAGQLYVSGSLNSLPNGYYRVEFFASTSPDASGYGQGQRYLGFINVATDASGNASVSTSLSASVAVGEYLSATATQSASGYATLSYTSEFSAALAVADFNDPPVLTPSGAGVAYVENQPAVILDSGILVTDVDSANFAGGTLTASLVAMGTGSDMLGIRNDGSGVGQIGLSGANVTYGGLVIGTRTGGTGGTPLVVSLSASADVSAVQALMRNLSFSSSGDAISDNTRTVRLVLAEGDGTISNNVDVSVLVEAVNDAPVISLPATQTVAEDTTITLGSSTGNPVSIADADALSAPVRVTLSVGNGVLTLASTIGLIFHTGDGTADGAIDITGTVADINAALDGMVFTPSTSFNGNGWLQIDVSDQGNSGTGGALTASQSLVIVVTPVNDPPAFSFVSGNSNYPENAGPVVLAPTGTVSDVDSANFDGGRLVVYFSNNGQPEDRIAIQNEGVGAGQISLNGSSVYVDGMVVGDWAGGTDGSTPLIVSFNSNATAAIVQAVARNISYENVSDAPSTAVRTMVGYVEDGDGGTSNLVSGTLTIIPSNDAPTIVSDGGDVSATVFVAENTTAASTVMAVDPDSTGLVYSIGGGADQTAFSINSVTGELRFVSAPDFESATDANGDNVYEVIVRVVDSNSATDTQTLFVTVTNTNEAPVVTLTQPGYTATEQVSLALAGTGMSIADIDAGNAVIRATLDVASGVLTASAGSTGVTVSGTGTTGLTFEGTQAQINDLLAGNLGSSLAYLINTDTPPVNDTLTLAVDDLGSSGNGSSASASAAVIISIAAVNDGPANSTPGAQVTAISTALVFSVGNGNSLSIADPDAGGAAIQASLTATHGTLTLSTITGLTFSVGDGSADSTLTFTGSLANINVALEGLVFTPDTAYNGDATITLNTSDQGNTGGGALTDSSLIHVQVGATRYQEGVDGYTGTQDTYVEDSTPSTAYGSATTVLTDDGSPLAQGLLKFDNLFGSGVGQIPLGATINSASLSFYVTQRDVADTVSLYRMLSTWSESSTWNTLGTGVQTDGSEAASTAETSFSAGTTGWNTLNGLAATVQAWADGAANHGWAFITQNPGADNWTFASSEYGTVNLRPYLVINYTPPAVPVITSNGGGASASVLVNENSIAVTTVTATDADSSPAELSYRIVGGDDQARFTINATTGVLRFISAPDHEAPSDVGGDNIYDVIVEVSDGFVADTQAIAVTVSNVNETPSFTSLGGTVIYTEDSAPAVIDSDVSIFDPELSADNNFSGATLTLTRSGGANALDNFSASGNLAALTEGGSLLLGGVNMGIVTTNTAGTLSLTFNANATQLRVNEVINSLAYANASNTPPSSVQITWVFNDNNAGAQGSGGALSASGSSTVNITATNDAPIASNLNAAQSYTEDTALTLTPIVVSDVDNATVTVTLTLSDTAAGSLTTGTSGAVTSTFVGGVWAASGAVGDVNALLASLSFTPSLDYNSLFTIATSVSDGSATLSGSKLMSGVAVNDAPIASNLNAAQSYTEDTALTLTPIVVSDVDNATVTVTLTLSDTAAGSLTTGTSGAVTSTFVGGVWAASGAVGDVNALLASLSFTPSLDYNSPFTIATSVSDGSATLSGSKLMSGVAVNDAPVLDTTGTMTLTPVTEDDASNAGQSVASIIVSAGGDRIADVDSAALEGVAIHGTSGALGRWEYSLDGSNWTDVGSVSSSAALLLRASDLIRFVPDGANGSIASFDFRAWDQSSGSAGIRADLSASGGSTAFSTTTGTAGIDVSAVNDAPVLAETSLGMSVAEDAGLPAGAVGALVSDFVGGIGDVDSGALQGIAIIASTEVNGTWYYSSDDGASWNALGPVSSANARLLAADEATRVYFSPAADYNGSVSAALTVRAWDQSTGLNGSLADTTSTGGSAAYSVAVDSISLTVTAVNDAPAITINTGASILEGSTNPITGAMLTASDVDNTAAQLTYTLTVIPTHGALYRDGVALMAGASFTQADIDANRLTYTHDGSETASDGFAFMVDDRAAAASAGSFTIAIAPVNDNAPIITSPGSVSVAENTTPVLTVSATDADQPAQTLSYSIAGGADAGLFSIDPASGILRFATAPDFDIPGDADGNNIYDVVVRVSDGGLASTQHLSITVLNRNEMPQGNDGRIVVAEDGAHVFTLADFGFADALDTPANNLAAVQIVSGPVRSVLSLGGQAVLDGQWVAAADIAAGLLIYAPSAEESGSAYAALTFRVRDDGGGSDTEAGVHTLVLDVTAVNDAPVAGGDTYSLDEDGVLDVAAPGVLANDPDRDGDALTAVLVSGPAHGSLVLAADGSFRYEPAANWSGTDSFSYRPFDGLAYGDPVQVRLVVAAVNDAPEIVHASFQVQGGGLVVLTADMIVAADVDSLPASIEFRVDRADNGHFELSTAPGQAIYQFSYADLAAGRVGFAHTVFSDLPIIELHADDGQTAGGIVRANLSFVQTGNTGPSSPTPVIEAPSGISPVAPPAPATPAKPAGNAAKPLLPQKPATPIVLADAGDGVVASAVGSGALPSNANEGARRHEAVDALIRFGQAQIKLSLGASPDGPLMAFMLTGVDPGAATSSSAASRSLDSKPKLPPIDDGAYSDVRVVLQSVELTGVALSVGAVWWASRAGGLVASLLMAAPAWRTFDPLPVLGPEDENDRDWGGDVDDEMARDEVGVADLFNEAREGMHS